MKLEERHYAETAREYALRMLKENIISMELKPGAMVSENELAAQLGLSRTPVREALMDMAQYGLVDILPQRGSRISLIDYALVEPIKLRVLRKTIHKRQNRVAVEQQSLARAGLLHIRKLTRGNAQLFR